MIDPDETNVQAGKIRQAVPPSRNPVCYQTTRDIIIPAGTILRDPQHMEIFSCQVGFGPGVAGEFQIEESMEAENCGVFKRVVA